MAKYGLEVARTRIVNIHGQVEDEEVPEMQELVIATSAMPRGDWVRAFVFIQMVELLYFDKLLQIPIVLVRKLADLTYREITEFFLEDAFCLRDGFPIFSWIRDFLREKAKNIQGGCVEYVHSSEWLNAYWPTHEFLFIELAARGKLWAFYREAEEIFFTLLKKHSVTIEKSALNDAIHLNENLLKLPFKTEDVTIQLSWNVWEFYRGVVTGKEVQLESGSSHFGLISRACG